MRVGDESPKVSSSSLTSADGEIGVDELDELNELVLDADGLDADELDADELNVKGLGVEELTTCFLKIEACPLLSFKLFTFSNSFAIKELPVSFYKVYNNKH